MLENTDKALGEIIEKLNALASPDTLAVMVRVTWFDSIGNIATGLAGLLGIYVAARLTGWIGAITKRSWDDLDNAFIDVGGSFGTVAVGIGTVIFTVFILLTLFDQWNWIGVFDPQTALAHSIMQKIGGK